MYNWYRQAEGRTIMNTRWVLRIPSTKFSINPTADERGHALEELFIDIDEGHESNVFLAMTKQLQGSMMKTARSALPVKTVPAPTAPSVRQQTMPATPIAGPGAGAPTPDHKTMPVRPPLSPSAIRPRKLPPSPSFGRLQNEQRMIQEKKNHASGITHPSNHVIPNSFERLTSETAARHTQPAPPPALGLDENPAIFDESVPHEQ